MHTVSNILYSLEIIKIFYYYSFLNFKYPIPVSVNLMENLKYEK